MIAEELKQAVHRALQKLGVRNPEVVFEHPTDLTHGDYSTNAALMYAKELKMKPSELAKRLCKGLTLNLQKGQTFAERIEVAGAGFINFYLSKEFFANVVKRIVQGSTFLPTQGRTLESDFGTNKTLAGQKIIVEYTDPNPFKEFHIGHLMSNAIGESIARLLEFQDAKVMRACWQGDVGLHVAKAIWGAPKLKVKSEKLKVAEWGEVYAKGSEAYETDQAAKKEIDALNKEIFAKSDEKVNKLYEAGRKVSLEHFEEIYKVLGTKFDYYFFEGKEGMEGKPIVEANVGKVFETSEGAIVYKGEKRGLHTRVFITSQGLPTYETKELGLNKAKFEKEPGLDASLIVTANEQSDYFKVVLAAMKEVLPEIAQKTKHIAHGMLRFASGKMSSRKGNIVTGEALIGQVKEMVREKLKDRELSENEKDSIAEVVAVGAIKYSILRSANGSDIIFDFEKSISFEGDSGPYLQYSYVRAKSVLKKAAALEVQPQVGKEVEPRKPSVLERLLYRFPEIVERAGEELQPHYIATYLIELAGAFNSWYANGRIVDAKDPSSSYKVALTGAFATVMQNGLWLLGIPVPEKM
ncbi:MAG: arginine--tRNA ligase [Patescibacteria group bacterium]